MDKSKQIAFFFEIFDATLPRLGPGDDLSTRRALDLLGALRSNRADAPGVSKLSLLDIGCGNGASTIQLANHSDGTILAIDNHQPYLDELKRRAQAEGVSEKIVTGLRDMSDLGSSDGPFDLIWSEGALYCMGFQNGLEACHSLLKPGAMMAVTELTWLRSDPPGECRQFFDNEYPAMTDIDTNMTAIRNCDFETIDHFILPESSWWDSFYTPLENRVQSLRQKYPTDPDRIELLDSIQIEINLYRQYSDYYGYIFYLMRRPV